MDLQPPAAAFIGKDGGSQGVGDLQGLCSHRQTGSSAARNPAGKGRLEGARSWNHWAVACDVERGFEIIQPRPRFQGS